MEVIAVTTEADLWGNSHPDIINTTENASDNTIMPIVGGHLIYLWLTKENNAARQIINVTISYDCMLQNQKPKIKSQKAEPAFFLKANKFLKWGVFDFLAHKLIYSPILLQLNNIY
jgi:hypothetical protein